MANILDRYGIKEVADVTFYEIGDNGQAGAPVLYLDTLKVSTIEQTAENTSARGGKGNPELIMWDYGKEINVTLEDALFSAKSMAIMFGNGKVDGEIEDILRTITFIGTEKPSKWEGPQGKEYSIPESAVVYNENGVDIGVKGLLEEYMGPCVVVYISNTSQKNISVQTRDVSINGFMVDAIFSSEVNAGKHIVDTITFLSSELEENGITTIEDIELSLHIFDSDTWMTIKDTNVITLSFAE